MASGTPSDAAATAAAPTTAQSDKKDSKDVQAQGAAATPDKPAMKAARGGKVVGTESKLDSTPAVSSPVPVLNVTGTDGETQKKEGRTPEKLRTVSLRCGDDANVNVPG
jgi:hypothetical protein